MLQSPDAAYDVAPCVKPNTLISENPSGSSHLVSAGVATPRIPSWAHSVGTGFGNPEVPSPSGSSRLVSAGVATPKIPSWAFASFLLSSQQRPGLVFVYYVLAYNSSPKILYLFSAITHFKKYKLRPLFISL